MSTKAYMTTIRLVGMEDRPYLTIKPSPDARGLVNVTTDSCASIGWFNTVNLTIDSVLARKLAEALIACADETEVE